MTNYREAKEIADALSFVYELCMNVKDHDRCNECPMSHLCLDDEETSIVDIFDLVSARTWGEFIEFCDNVTFKEEDLEAQYADYQRKYEQEERAIYGY